MSEAPSWIRPEGWRPVRGGEAFSGRLGDGRRQGVGGEVEHLQVPSAAHRRRAARGRQIHLLQILYLRGRLRGLSVHQTAARSRIAQPSSEDI